MTYDAKDNAAVTRDVARELYETTPSTFDQVASEVGVTSRTVKRWSSEAGGWSKLDGPEITERAMRAADKITAAVVQVDDAARPAVTAELRTEAAIDERALVLARHRKEWSVVRALVGEAAKSRCLTKAKLATEVARALDLAQRGESRAWGLDTGEGAQGGQVTIVIERQ